MISGVILIERFPTGRGFILDEGMSSLIVGGVSARIAKGLEMISRRGLTNVECQHVGEREGEGLTDPGGRSWSLWPLSWP